MNRNKIKGNTSIKSKLIGGVIMSVIAKIWAESILKGKKLYSEVPEKFKEDVKSFLIQKGHDELLED